MAKEVMILNAEEIGGNLTASAPAVDAYRFALENAGLAEDEGAAADFIVRRNAKSGWRDLWELKAWCEKTAASIKEVLKHTFNVGSSDELPAYVKWSKQSYTYEFPEGAGAIVANTLVEKGLVTVDQLFSTLTVSNVAKASGITAEKIVEMFPDVVLAKPKERTLSVK